MVSTKISKNKNILISKSPYYIMCISIMWH